MISTNKSLRGVLLYIFFGVTVSGLIIYAALEFGYLFKVYSALEHLDIYQQDLNGIHLPDALANIFRRPSTALFAEVVVCIKHMSGVYMPWTKSICPSRVFPDSWKQIIFGRHLLHIYTFSLVLDIVSTLGFLTWSAVLIIGKASNPSRRIQVTAIFGVSSVFMILANVVYIFLGLNNIIFTGFTLGLFVLFGFLLVSKLSGTTEKLAPLPVSVTSVHPGEVDIHQIIIGPDYKQSAPQQQYNQKVYQPAMVPRQTVLQNPYLTVGYYQNQQQQQRQSCSCHQHQCGQSIYPDPPVPQYEGFEIIPHPSSHISAPIPIPKPAQAPPEYTPGAGLYGEPKCHGK